MKANLNRGAVIFTSIVAGMIIGLFAGAYLYTAWVPASEILKNASPKYLNVDRVNNTPQYRDFYVVRAAEKYHRDQQTLGPNAIQSAYAVLGVSTGDTTIGEAVEMVNHTQQVVAQENSTNGDAGVFTQDEELDVKSLYSALVGAQSRGDYPKIDMVTYEPVVVRNTTRIVGFVLLLALALIAFVVIYLVDRWTTARTQMAAAYANDTYAPAGVVLHEPAAAPASSNVTVNVSPTAPGIIGSQAANPAPAPAVSSARVAETPIDTFPPTVYRHGDDSFDQDFTIKGPMGELIGECGASIADRIGVDSPARVCALSLWVFDKNDFQSTTKILLSDFAWNDPVIRTKMKARGDAVQAVNGGAVEILTTMLRVVVQVSDLALNTDNNPPQGYFENVSLTFTVYKR